jgi:hypothetical protein
MLSKETSVADWERIMAQGSQSSWKDEYLVTFFIARWRPLWIDCVSGVVARLGCRTVVLTAGWIYSTHHCQQFGMQYA